MLPACWWAGASPGPPAEPVLGRQKGQWGHTQAAWPWVLPRIMGGLRMATLGCCKSLRHLRGGWLGSASWALPSSCLWAPLWVAGELRAGECCWAVGAGHSPHGRQGSRTLCRKEGHCWPRGCPQPALVTLPVLGDDADPTTAVHPSPFHHPRHHCPVAPAPSWVVLSLYLKATPLLASKGILWHSNPSPSTTTQMLSNECQRKGEKEGDTAERWHSRSDALWWGSEGRQEAG